MSEIEFVIKNPFDRTIICHIFDKLKFLKIFGVPRPKWGPKSISNGGIPGDFFLGGPETMANQKNQVFCIGKFVATNTPFWRSTTGLIHENAPKSLQCYLEGQDYP